MASSLVLLLPHKMASSPGLLQLHKMASSLGFPLLQKDTCCFTARYLGPSLQREEWDSFLTAGLCKRRAPIPPHAASLGAARRIRGRARAWGHSPSAPHQQTTLYSGSTPASEAPAGLPVDTLPLAKRSEPWGRPGGRCGSPVGLPSCEPNTPIAALSRAVPDTQETPSAPSPSETASPRPPLSAAKVKVKKPKPPNHKKPNSPLLPN